ncbi:MAG: CRISPR-associated helicase Cas3' [Dehalococcoidales bacterium]|nr:CRISPR-associated helicase Cas3' [Dehalococcoidales bacterium]
MDQLLSHVDRDTGRVEPLKEHLELVAERAKEYASALGASEEAYMAGLMHDLGKYGEPFQRRLRGEGKYIDHWSAGAWEILQLYKSKGIASALAIQGHHLGLQCGNKDNLAKLNPQHLKERHPLNLKLSEGNIRLLEKDGLSVLPEDKINSLFQVGINNTSSMLDVRMLYSAIVDADFIETEAWFSMDDCGNRKYRKPGMHLKPEEALCRLNSHLATIKAESDSSHQINQVRADLYQACIDASLKHQGLFTLSAPTGSGKTMAMLAFALSHAIKHKLRRIIVVIPYLSIIEQTIRAYRKVFHPYLSSEELGQYILEHHSLSNSKKNSDEIEVEDYSRRLLTENWDAPVIVTTSVQLLESLFSNRPSSCRKLHRLAGSVILFDEVQTLPFSLAIPTLAALSHLSEKYRSTVVFSTATQPAFNHLDSFVKKHCSNGWNPQEIVPTELKLFSRAGRTRINWPKQQGAISWVGLAKKLAKYKQVLCVTNLKKHATLLLEEVEKENAVNNYHLSTNMCPAHRQAVLDKVKDLLGKRFDCRLISTQCIEAGVDIDFPVVYRAMGPLEAIAQAAGRCNRNGNLPEKGEVFVFKPETDNREKIYPDGAYQQGATVTEMLLVENAGELALDEPSLYLSYYRKLYSFTRPESHKQELYEAIQRQNFIEVNRLYRIIDQDTINVLVPYFPEGNRQIFDSLRNEVLNKGLNRDWIRQARPYSVSLFRPKYAGDSLYDALEPVKISTGEDAEDWYIYKEEGDYDNKTGLNPSRLFNAIIA